MSLLNFNEVLATTVTNADVASVVLTTMSPTLTTPKKLALTSSNLPAVVPVVVPEANWLG